MWEWQFIVSSFCLFVYHMKLKEKTDLQELQEALDRLFPRRFEEGYTKATVKFCKDDLPALLEALLHQNCIVPIRNELEQFMDGMYWSSYKKPTIVLQCCFNNAWIFSILIECRKHVFELIVQRHPTTLFSKMAQMHRNHKVIILFQI